MIVSAPCGNPLMITFEYILRSVRNLVNIDNDHRSPTGCMHRNVEDVQTGIYTP